MAKKIYFTAGPAELYFTVESHLRDALRQQIPSISHRSQQFSKLYQETEEHLKALANIPDSFHVFFTSSATEIWERTLQSCVQHSSLHLVNGAFSKRFATIGQQLGKDLQMITAEPGAVVQPSQINSSELPDLVAVTHNETSMGTQQPLEHLQALRTQFPETLISVDVVSSFPLVQLPFDLIDMAYFSVQKCFGLPAGLGVWILNKRSIERALALQDVLHSAYHGIPSFWDKYQKYQTPATPNVLNIYLLNGVLQDMLQKGIDRIRNEGIYKSTILYQMLEQHHFLRPFVEMPENRSQTVVVADSGTNGAALMQHLDAKGLVVGAGYGSFKTQQVRIANFPTHSKEQMELLVDTISAFHS
jgi:phosphoserine aminotransferase